MGSLFSVMNAGTRVLQQVYVDKTENLIKDENGNGLFAWMNRIFGLDAQMAADLLITPCIITYLLQSFIHELCLLLVIHAFRHKFTSHHRCHRNHFLLYFISHLALFKLNFLIRAKGRADELDAVLGYFLSVVKEYKKIGVVDVASAVELTDAQKEKLCEKLLATTDYATLEGWMRAMPSATWITVPTSDTSSLVL